MTIDRHLLTKVTHVVCHGPDCPDGIASALILRHLYPEAKRTFVEHNTQKFRELVAEPGMLFCDCTPPADRAHEFLSAATLVLDHHKKQEATTRLFADAGFGVFADEKQEPGVSGAVLAYREVLEPLWAWGHCIKDDVAVMGELAHLVGIRDTWQRQDPQWDEAQRVSAALRFMGLDEAWRINIPVLLKTLDTIGRYQVNNHRRSVQRAIEGAVRWRIPASEHTRILGQVEPEIVMFQGGSAVTSDAAEQLGANTITVGFGSWKGDDGLLGYQYSLRSRGDFDVGALAVWAGGGGHIRAAGFRIPVTDIALGLNPYAAFRVVLDTYMATLRWPQTTGSVGNRTIVGAGDGENI